MIYIHFIIFQALIFVAISLLALMRSLIVLIIFNTNKNRNYKENKNMLDQQKQNNTAHGKHYVDLSFHFEKDRKKTERRQPNQFKEQISCLHGSKVTIYYKNRNALQEKKTEQTNKRKLSNFELLKRKISYLENEEILGNKQQQHQKITYSRKDEEQPYVVCRQFCSSKKTLLFQKYKLGLKQRPKRQLSHTIFAKKNERPSICNLQPTFAGERIKTQMSECANSRKRQLISQSAKRYFCAQNNIRNFKSSMKLKQSATEVKGTKLQSMSTAFNRSTFNFH